MMCWLGSISFFAIRQNLEISGSLTLAHDCVFIMCSVRLCLLLEFKLVTDYVRLMGTTSCEFPHPPIGMASHHAVDFLFTPFVGCESLWVGDHTAVSLLDFISRPITTGALTPRPWRQILRCMRTCQKEIQPMKMNAGPRSCGTPSGRGHKNPAHQRRRLVSPVVQVLHRWRPLWPLSLVLAPT